MLELKNLSFTVQSDAATKEIIHDISLTVGKGKFVKYSTDLSDRIPLGNVMQAGATDDVYIVKLERNIPQRIRMFVWLEGQDADCTNLTDAATLMLNLELAGSTAEETTG